MRISRLLVSMTGLTALLGGITPAAAATAVPAADAPGTQVSAPHRLPPAPRLPAGVRAVAPRVAPAADYDEYPGGAFPAPCSSGVLCPAVWNPASGKWRQYHLSSCSAYQLFNWQGEGGYFDNQTGNVTSYFYDPQGRVLHSFTPDRANHNYNWDPVWSIRNC
ncbi:hypothetical protein ABZ172_24485 [Streptomyces sp. NPDC006296]|uniref:hypothetical protein n=1 Tax=Streptomyces sp. NPDC006296 TaxID=3156746 RepID=UPI0033B61D44